MKSEFDMRTHAMAERFLIRKGCEIVDSSPLGGVFDLVAKTEEGIIVFVTLDAQAVGKVDGLPVEKRPDRAALERAAAKWLAGYSSSDFPVRFDSMALLVLNDSRGFLRYHKNVLG